MPEHGSKSASVGPQGDRVRSDLNVGFEPTSGALTVDVTSKVDYLYGEAIESAVRRVTDAFAVTTGRLTVNDAGALEWVILARVECCLRRAGLDGPPVLPEPAPGADVPRNRDRLRRSRLYIPGNQPKLMVSGGLYGADGIILDLEDSVPPAEKDAARLLVRNALVALDWGASERMVRVNQGAVGEEDLVAIATHNPHTVLLPKVEDASQVGRAAEILRGLAGEEAAFLMPILESPAGVHRAFDIATADPLVVALTLGLEDLSAELAAPRTTEGWENEDALAAYVHRERGLGFDGIGCIHPRQIPVVHREMAPSEAEAERAVRVVRAAREAEERGLGAVAESAAGQVGDVVALQAAPAPLVAAAGGEGA